MLLNLDIVSTLTTMMGKIGSDNRKFIKYSDCVCIDVDLCSFNVASVLLTYFYDHFQYFQYLKTFKFAATLGTKLDGQFTSLWVFGHVKVGTTRDVHMKFVFRHLAFSP